MKYVPEVPLDLEPKSKKKKRKQPARPVTPTPLPPPVYGLDPQPFVPNQVDEWYGPTAEGAGLAALKLLLQQSRR